MTGILHLCSVPKLKRNQNRFESLLFKCIRDAADRDSGRDVPLEDYYHEVLSYLEYRSFWWFVRFSNVDDKGRPFGNLGLTQTLFDITKTNLIGSKFIIIEPDDTRYLHHYNADNLSGDFLYVPDSQFVRTLVVTKCKSL